MKVNGRVKVAPGIEVIPCEGHTPGHQVVRIDGGRRADTGKPLLYYWIGDAMHHLAQISSPDWSPAFDWNPVEASEARINLMQNLHDEKAMLMSPHFPYPGCGTIKMKTSTNIGADVKSSDVGEFIFHKSES